MRVTKIIKEYVENQVNNMYKDKIYIFTKEEEFRIKEVKETISKIERKYQEAFFEELKVLLKERNCVTCNWSHHEIPLDINFNSSCFFQDIMPNGSNIEERTKQYELYRKEKKDKIDEILVSLELGASKKELEKMLSNLK